MRNGRMERTWWLLWLGILLLVPLQAPLVVAKGGGHGGGGGGGGGGGSGRRRRVPPPYLRQPDIIQSIPWTVWLRERWNPLGFHNVPRREEAVRVLVDWRQKTYRDGTVTSVSREMGKFVVAVEVPTDVDRDKKEGMEDEEEDMRKAEEVPTRTVEFELRGDRNLHGWLALGGIVFCVWIYNRHLRNHDRKAREFDAALVKELLMTMTSTHPPVSGSYLGFTTESDNMEQRVDAELEFGSNGTITGMGEDSRDGSYTIEGHYSGTRVKWVETYRKVSPDDVRLCGTPGNHEGMVVTVRGSFTKGRRFDCFFRSSRGITGEVVLSLKKMEKEAAYEDLRRRNQCKHDAR